MTFKLKVK